MKKIIAIMLVLAAVLSLASCKVKSGNDETEPYNHEEYLSNLAAAQEEQSKAAAEKAEKEAEIQEEIDDYIKKVGKTRKKSQLVLQIKVPEHMGREYWKFEYKANGDYKTKIEYYFLDSREQYNAKVEIAKSIDGLKLVEKDEETRMVVIRNDKFNGRSFDKMYEAYSAEIMAEKGYSIIE